MKKKQLGQFFTTNCDYILQGLNPFVRGKRVADPFAGNGDLISWAKKNGAKVVVGYDIDHRYAIGKKIIHNDSILNPQEYDFVITNPPYLNVNKATSKTKGTYFSNSQFEDLYQASIYSILNSEEGILIVPINFLSAENAKKIRSIFFSKFKIIKLNYFREPVFTDTTYNVVSFYYRKKDAEENKNIFNACLFPDGKNVSISLEKKFDWVIGGDFVSRIRDFDNHLGIRRLTEQDVKRKGEDSILMRLAYNHVKTKREFAVDGIVQRVIKRNVILLKAIDSGSEKGKIALEDVRSYGVSGLVSKESSRHMIQLIFGREISIEEQEGIINLFNEEINSMREKYFSLFLTNYRDNDRKRISFDFVYKFINYLYFNKLNPIPFSSSRQFGLFAREKLTI